MSVKKKGFVGTLEMILALVVLGIAVLEFLQIILPLVIDLAKRLEGTGSSAVEQPADPQTKKPGVALEPSSQSPGTGQDSAGEVTGIPGPESH